VVSGDIYAKKQKTPSRQREVDREPPALTQFMLQRKHFYPTSLGSTRQDGLCGHSLAQEERGRKKARGTCISTFRKNPASPLGEGTPSARREGGKSRKSSNFDHGTTEGGTGNKGGRCGLPLKRKKSYLQTNLCTWGLHSRPGKKEEKKSRGRSSIRNSVLNKERIQLGRRLEKEEKWSTRGFQHR